VLPLSAALSKLLDFLIGFLILVSFLIYFQMKPSKDIWMLPFLLLNLLLCSLGLGMILASMSLQYRDIKHALSFIVQLLMYGAPVVYATSSIPKDWLSLYSLNPMVGVIEGFRSIFLQTIPFPWAWVLYGSIMSIFMFITGVLYFKRMERTFADVA
jgi:lipopolysaccharide transport system permease protein